MANTNYEFIYTVEDYSAVTTTVVMTAGQARWFNTVPGFDADEVIPLVGDGTLTLAELVAIKIASYKAGDYDIIDTDSAPVAATIPTSPVDGQVWDVVNGGTSGNNVTGLPGTISLGDGKRISFIYDNTNSLWRYEDVIIDEYTDSDQNVIKWSGGKMEIAGKFSTTIACSTAAGALYRTVQSATGASFNYVESFTATPMSSIDLVTGTTSVICARLSSATYNSVSTLGFQIWRTASSASDTYSMRFISEGRWKTGI